MFSPSVIAQIVSTIHNRRDLLNLALIDDFHDAATARLYYHIALSSPTRAIQLCNSIVSSASYTVGEHDPQHPQAKLYLRRKELAKYVRVFVFSQDWSRSASMFAMDAGLDPDLGASFWSQIRSMLVLLPNLQILALVDATSNHSFIFDHPEEFSFRLSDLRIRFAWDERLAAFLKTQEAIKSLTIQEGSAKRLLPGMRSVGGEPLAKVVPGTGKNIISYEGPITIARDLSSSKLSNIQSIFPTATPQHLHTLISRNRHLRSLTLYETPEERVEWVLELVAAAELPLVHLGVLAIPLDVRCMLFPVPDC